MNAVPFESPRPACDVDLTDTTLFPRLFASGAELDHAIIRANLFSVLPESPEHFRELAEIYDKILGHFEAPHGKGELVRSIHAGEVCALRLVAGGASLVTVSRSGPTEGRFSVELLDVRGGAVAPVKLAELTAKVSFPRPVKLGCAGRGSIIAFGWTGRVPGGELHSVGIASGAPLSAVAPRMFEWEDDLGRLLAVQPSPDGFTVAAAMSSELVFIDAATGERETFRDTEVPLSTAAFSQDSDVVALRPLFHAPGSVLLIYRVDWAERSLLPIGELPSPPDLLEIFVSPDGRFLGTLSYNTDSGSCVRVYSLRGEDLGTEPVFTARAPAISSPVLLEEERVAFLDNFGTAYIFPLSRDIPSVRHPFAGSISVFGQAFSASPDGGLIASASRGGTVDVVRCPR